MKRSMLTFMIGSCAILVTVFQNCSGMVAREFDQLSTSSSVTTEGPALDQSSAADLEFAPAVADLPASTGQTFGVFMPDPNLPAALRALYQGRALVASTSDGRTVLNAVLTSPPITGFTTPVMKLHQLNCVDQGPVYKINEALSASSESNEIWLKFDGATPLNSIYYDFYSKTVNHTLRPGPKSVVLHSGDGTKIACADLQEKFSLGSLGGRFRTLPDGAASALNLTGSAQITRLASGTSVYVHLAGLPPDTRVDFESEPPVQYLALLHAQSCAEGGDVRYKIDPLAPDSQRNNVWSYYTVDQKGKLWGSFSTAHVARTDARSVVVYDSSGHKKLACADLIQSAGLRGAYNSADYQVNGTVKMARNAQGQTQFAIGASGLLPNTQYSAYVFVMPCPFNNPLALYLKDRSLGLNVESNKVSVQFTTDSKGSATASLTIDHWLRAEAASLHILDPFSNTGIACAELY